ncbi:hypothetical protein M2138_000387 [Dysgonomonadaceae bacterium PH5-43]|nr:hypothetical protein [Dysgonomonadaceae bacterium PH5-43]
MKLLFFLIIISANIFSTKAFTPGMQYGEYSTDHNKSKAMNSNSSFSIMENYNFSSSEPSNTFSLAEQSLDYSFHGIYSTSDDPNNTESGGSADPVPIDDAILFMILLATSYSLVLRHKLKLNKQ